MAVKSTPQQLSLAEGVDKELTCAICLCRYDHPKVLPCLHSYCKECLEKLAKKTRPPKQELVCPQCKEVHQIPPQGIDAFKTYFTVNNLLELLRVHEATASGNGGTKKAAILCESGVDENPAVAHCLTCSDHLCESCFELHKKQKLSRDHNVVLLKDLSQLDQKTGVKSVHRKQHCDEHKDELLKLFCKACEKVICRDCALVKHRDHDYVFVHEFRPEAQRQLVGLVKKAKEKQSEFKVHCDSLAKIRESSSASFDTSRRELNATFDKLIKSIENRRKALLADFDALSETEEKKLNAETDYLEIALARLSNSIQFTEKLFDNEDDVEVMLMCTQAKPALESLQQLSWYSKKVETPPVRVVFDQYDLKKCESLGCICQSLKDGDVKISELPKESKGSFSFEISLFQETSLKGIDYTPVLLVQVMSTTTNKEEAVDIQKKKGLNKWKISCKPEGTGQYKVTVNVDTIVKENIIQIYPEKPFVGMKVVRGPDWLCGSLYDGGAGTVGEVVAIRGDSRVNVKWPNGLTIVYHYGKDNKYHVKKYD